MSDIPPSTHVRLLPGSSAPTLRLFGAMRADLASGGSFLPQNRRTRAVLAILALADKKIVSRDLLIELLWRSRGREQAQSSLRQSVHELRGCLAHLEGAELRTERHGLTLVLKNVWVDAVFAQSSGLLPSQLEEVFRGPLLSDLEELSDRFRLWILAERVRLAEIIRPKLNAFLLAMQSPDTLARMAEAMLSHDPSHEAAWVALAGSHMRRGDRTAALDAYYRCVSQSRTLPDTNTPDPNKVLAQCFPERAAQIGTASQPAQAGTLPVSQRLYGPATGILGSSHSACIAIAPLKIFGNAPADLALSADWEIVAALCQFEDLQCATVSFDRELELAPRRLASDGFDFLLDGCISAVAGKNRVMLRLRDLRMNGAVFWSQRMSLAASGPDMSDFESVAAFAPQIAVEIKKYQAIMLENHLNPEPHIAELVLRASVAAQYLDRHALLKVDELLRDVMKRGSRQPALFAWSAYIETLLMGQGWSADDETPRRRIGEAIDRAMSLSPETASVLSIAGHVLAFSQNRLDAGLLLQERALAKNPQLPSAWLFSGLAHTYAGQHKEAISRLQRAKLLSPADDKAFFMEMGLSLSYLLDGDGGMAMRASECAIRLNPNFSSSLKVGLAASAHADQRLRDPRQLKRLLELEPALTVKQFLARTPLTQKADQMRLADGLRLAGLPG